MEPNQGVRMLILFLFIYLLCPQLSSGQIKNGQTYYIQLATGTNYIRPANGEAATRVLLQARNKTTATRADFKWRIISAGKGYYFFIHQESGLAMDIRSSRAGRGSDIWLATWNGSDSQKFKFDMREKGKIFIESKENPSLVLNTKTNSNFTLELNRRDASFLNVWKVEPTEENRTGGGLPAPMPNLSNVYRSGGYVCFFAILRKI